MKFSSSKRRKSYVARSAFTLLELLLALALTVVVISTIATAIHVNLFSLTRAQANIERKQIARSVMAMIGNDIRAAVQFRAADFSGLEEVLRSQQLIAGVQATGIEAVSADELSVDSLTVDAIESAVEAQQSQASSTSPTTSDDFTSSDDIADEEVDEWSVGLVGDANFIMLDISRLPRIDQYHPLIQTAQDDVTTGSDIKQVVYYVAAVGGQDRSNNVLIEQSAANRQGLFRDEIDRAVAFYQGGINPGTPKEYSQLIANEIVRIQFRYFDGTDWLSQWDSAENAGFPSAVEVSIVVDTNPLADPTNNFQNDGRFEQYRSVVHLPLAEIQEEDADE